MTNREWLNTLDIKEYTQAILDAVDMATNTPGNDFTNLWDFFYAQHKTTADEDFAEIGFRPEKSYINGWVFYSGNEVNVAISKDEIEYSIKYRNTIRVLKDTMIDQIRTIADKKRKEMGVK